MTTRRERLEAKLEKRQEWAESRRRKADAAFKAASNIAGSIPLGQPILVGHHSEGKMRRLYGKIDSNMHKGVESADMARHHAGKAAGLMDGKQGVCDACGRKLILHFTGAADGLSALLGEGDWEARTGGVGETGSEWREGEESEGREMNHYQQFIIRKSEINIPTGCGWIFGRPIHSTPRLQGKKMMNATCVLSSSIQSNVASNFGAIQATSCCRHSWASVQRAMLQSRTTGASSALN